MTFGGQFILDWDDVVNSSDPRGTALEFAQSLFAYSCDLCEWDPTLAASAERIPPPVS